MRNVFAIANALLACLLLGLAACRSHAPVAESAPLRVMSFNVRVPVEADGPDRWEQRRDLLVQLLRETHPDLIGTQELVAAQGEYIATRLPQYAWFGSGRRGAQGDASDEHMGVFYRRDALRLLESGDFWLSDTPDMPGSISWGHPYPRMVSWGLFERVADARRFYLFNTHLPYRKEDGAARARGVQAILARIATLPRDVPVVVVGDFNDEPESGAYRALAGALGDAWVDAQRREGPEDTFHAFSGTPTRRIDWVFQRGFRVQRAQVLTDQVEGRYPSDHFPVLVQLE